MSERDTLLDWLDRAATRVRQHRLLEDAAALGGALLVLLAVHQWLRVVVEPIVRAALLPFVLFAAAAVLTLFLVRRVRAPTRDQAAAATDRNAGLKDEVRSAGWFAGHEQTASAALLIARAARTVQALDVHRVFPLPMPRAAAGASLLALLAIAAAWTLPSAHTPADTGAAAGASAAARAARSAAEGAGTPAARLAAPPDLQQQARARSIWSQVEALASGLRGEDEADALGQAIRTRDAKGAAQLLQRLLARRAAQPRPAGAARPQSEQMSDTLAAAILERIEALAKEEEAQADADGSARTDAPTAHLTEQLRADEEAQPGDSRGQHSAGEDALNAMLRAINRSGIGSREVVGNAGENAQEAGPSNQGGGAMGRRVSTTTAGGGDGERPKGDPKGEAEAQPVLGEKTVRLQAQLQRVKVEATPEEEAGGGEDALYAATRAQAARTDYEQVTARAQSSAENAVSSAATPLAYRDAVKRYTLEQHRTPTRP